MLIHSFEVKDGKVRADLEWTFPLSQVEIVTGDGKDAKRRTVPVNGDRPDAIATDYGIGIFGTVGTLPPP